MELNWYIIYLFLWFYLRINSLWTALTTLRLLGFLVDNIYVAFGDQVFQQSVGIPMGTNCANLLADI